MCIEEASKRIRSSRMPVLAEVAITHLVLGLLGDRCSLLGG
jgi:hypothetical protein